MPTGYTNIIEDNENCTFADYVWRCAREFGALVHMRDDDLDEEITEANSYNNCELLERLRKELSEAERLSEGEAEVRASSVYDEQLQDYESQCLQEVKRVARYGRMKSLVIAWKPPTSGHAELKKFMIEQIEKCEHPYFRDPPKALTGEEWKLEQIARLQSSIEHEIEYARKDAENIKSRRDWVTQLANSVPMPSKEKDKE